MMVVMVVVYSLISLIIMTPLALELGKRRSKFSAAEEEPDVDVVAT
jgi:hypothetical protein